MQATQIRTLLVALSLGAAASAGAQTYVPATGDVVAPADAAPSIPQPLVTSPALAPAPADISPDVQVFTVTPSDDATVILLAPDVMPTGIDSKAYAKCRGAGVNSFWDCVNGANGAQ